MDTDEEPRRGASRANSVRFDESALHGHFGHNSRSSSEFFPLRTGSGMGGHLMTERSSSHKSDGRQSSMGVSAHSTRLNSLAFDSRQAVEDNPSMGPPPGLSFLGPLPAIIRCWLDTNFSNESLLYAAICTGSYRSVLSSSMVIKLGLAERIIQRDRENRLKLQVYLPEATVQHPFTRPASPASQLPAITVDFEVHDTSTVGNGIQIFLGSDMLRAKSADIIFSQDRMSILDDDRNRLAVPLVRPENLAIFRSLVTLNVPDMASLSVNTKQDGLISTAADGLLEHQSVQADLRTGSSADEPRISTGTSRNRSNVISPIAPPTKPQSTTGDAYGNSSENQQAQDGSAGRAKDVAEPSIGQENGVQLEATAHGSHVNAWSSWRRDSAQNTRHDSTFSSVASSSAYHKPARGKGMKVLKPTRSSASRSASTVQTPTSVDIMPRWPDDAFTHHSDMTNASINPKTTESPRASFSNDSKSASAQMMAGTKARSANPVGGASAFGWLNSSQKQPSASME